MSVDAPQLARTTVTDWAEGLPIHPERREALKLLVSELVSNAVCHSQSPPEEPIRLVASFVGSEVVVTVTDAGRAGAPEPRAPTPLTGGYGLHLVRSEAIRWGVDRAEGTRVWFSL